MLLFTLVICLLLLHVETGANPCNERIYADGTVCVCDSTYCDSIPRIGQINTDEYEIYRTSQKKLGINKSTGKFIIDSTSSVNIRVNINEKYQNIIGFGGAFTDSTGININSLPSEAQTNLLNSYFADDGLEYSLCRVPIGGTDFSERGYSYDDVDGDETLKHFKLEKEDLQLKIPHITKAKELKNGKPFRLFASAWSSPKWMKTNNDWGSFSFLISKYYQTWANYYVRFFEEYEKQNISFWGITTQNEPSHGLLHTTLNSIGWLPFQMIDWVNNYLGPTIRSSNFKDLKIILHDDTRLSLPIYFPKLLDDIKYADGVGLHWYENEYLPISLNKLAQSTKEGFFQLATEACAGYLNIFGLEPSVVIGSWARGEKYAEDIIKDLEYNISGWVDWNMALDLSGGPNYINNYVDSPILVNASSGEFYKQPMFYVMGHFSKFIIPDSVRVGTLTEVEQRDDLSVIAFMRPDNLLALVIYNKGDTEIAVNVENKGKIANIVIEARSINTMLFKGGGS